MKFQHGLEVGRWIGPPLSDLRSNLDDALVVLLTEFVAFGSGIDTRKTFAHKPVMKFKFSFACSGRLIGFTVGVEELFACFDVPLRFELE